MSASDALNRDTTSHNSERASEQGNPIETLRAGIDSVDEQIVRLLDRRARLARRIGEIKQERGLEAYAPARERAPPAWASRDRPAPKPRRARRAAGASRSPPTSPAISWCIPR